MARPLTGGRSSSRAGAIAAALALALAAVLGGCEAGDGAAAPSDVADSDEAGPARTDAVAFGDLAPADLGPELDPGPGLDPGLDLDLGPGLDPGPGPDPGPDPGTPRPDPTELLNAGFIGGGCSEDSDCDFEGGHCLSPAEGFPGGLCARDCDRLCPDRPGAAVTFCLDPAEVQLFGDSGLCVMRCDFGGSPSGCRPGYQCAAVARHSEPETGVYACIPGSDRPIQLSACHEELIARGVPFSPEIHVPKSPEGHPELLCTVEDPVRISGVLRGVAFRYAEAGATAGRLFASCPLALSLDKTAEMLAEQGVSDLLHYGIYNCRLISGTSKLSQHGHANALDIAGFKMSSGALRRVQSDWELDTALPQTDAGAFLKWFVETAFDLGLFNIILTPDYNEAHADHFHCDLSPGKHFLK